MYWEETQDKQHKTDIPDDIVDLMFSISCRTLPVDHAYALSEAIKQALPWVKEEPEVGIHTIHVAASGNGWMRPDSPGQVLHPSRRTKLTLRVPKARVDDAQRLVDKTLDISGHELTVNSATQKLLSPISTVFARYVVLEKTESEVEFMNKTIELLRTLGIKPKKMLCGIEQVIKTPTAKINTRSLMLAELSFDETIKLQQKGLGAYRAMGCGIFIPHKDIAEVSD